MARLVVGQIIHIELLLDLRLLHLYVPLPMFELLVFCLNKWHEIGINLLVPDLDKPLSGLMLLSECLKLQIIELIAHSGILFLIWRIVDSLWVSVVVKPVQSLVPDHGIQFLFLISPYFVFLSQIVVIDYFFGRLTFIRIVNTVNDRRYLLVFPKSFAFFLEDID